MRLAFLIYKYFPYGGLQRDMRRFAEQVIELGHDCRIYFISWQGEPVAGADQRQVPVSAFSNHRRDQRFLHWVQADLARDPVDGVIGFNKMPGLDVYYAGDPCYLDKALEERGPLYRRGARFRHFAAWEHAVFAPQSETHILLLAASEREKFVRHYHTPTSRMTLLPPGVAPDRRAGEDALARRRAARRNLGLEDQEFTLLFVGSGFITKGLDRAITSLANMASEQPSVKARMLVVGQDSSRRFVRLARRLGVGDAVQFLGGRDDVADLMLAADLLVHPAIAEAAGIVLLEAVTAGLPVVVTDVCGYAHYVTAARAGIVLPAPFSQEQLDRAIMRFIDGIFRAECRQAALLYARLTDLYGMHSQGAKLMVELSRKRAGAAMADCYVRGDFGTGELVSATALLQWARGIADAAGPENIYRHKEGRRTLRFEKNGRSYFLKLHSGVGWAEIFKNLVQGRLPVVSAANEYHAVKALEQRGVDTLEVAAYAAGPQPSLPAIDDCHR